MTVISMDSMMKGTLILPKDVPSYIDHTLLKPEATQGEIEKVVSEAMEFHFYGVCIERKWIPVVKRVMAGTRESDRVRIVTVVDFPGGRGGLQTKVSELKEAMDLGADEVDIVCQRELLHLKNYSIFLSDLSCLSKEAGRICLKLILETSELSEVEIAIACSLAKIAGFSFVKTSTGFSQEGATVSHVSLMRSVVGPSMGVKASGGVRSYDHFCQMITAGASRIGTSSSVKILKEAEAMSCR